MNDKENVIQFPEAETAEEKVREGTDTDMQEEDHLESAADGEQTEQDDDVSSRAGQPMPNALASRLVKTVLIGAGIAILTTVFAIIYRDIRYLGCVPVGLGVALWGLNLRRLYYSGAIEERAMRCINITANKNRTRARVSFEDARGNFHEFRIDNRGEPFVTDAVYILYSKKGHPTELIGWQLL